MSARRQSSTTSLARYARASSPDLNNRSLDFCNAFWGAGDGGVDVLFARMRGAGRTMDELRGFWKERSAIEEEYAKRLSKLAKQTLGKDEIGELRNSLDTLRLETDKQATAHANLAQHFRNDLENPVSAFVTRQTGFKKTHQATIEKEFKAKQIQESYVNKAREKYEADCLKINTFTAQSTLMQGKELEKLTLKLERAKQTVTANERDFANFARALQDTVMKWEKNWKNFCDGCQDMEEDRIEFMKDNMWAYANAVSTVCVADDESCEHIRCALEQLEPERDMENFVRDYGTGSQIPEPPQFVNHANPDSQFAVQRSSTRIAHFPRSTQRHGSMAHAMRPPPPEEEPTGAGSAGIGAGGAPRGRESEPINRSETQSRASSRGRLPTNGTADSVHSPTPAPLIPQQAAFTGGPSTSQAGPSSSSYGRPPQDHMTQPIGPAHETMLKIGDNAYKVEPDRDPQNVRPSAGPAPSTAGPSGSGASNKVGDDSDPLARAMQDLRGAAGTIRRGTSTNASKPPPQTHTRNTGSRGEVPQAGPSSSQSPSSALSPPGGSSSQPLNRDYRNSAEVVVGSYPGAISGPSSPINPPTASLMQPPPQPGGSLPVQAVVERYHQSFPGERKSISRPSSRASNAPPAQEQSAHRASMIERPVSREGHAGIGAGGRSPSPGLPYHGTSPVPLGNRTSLVSPGPSGPPPPRGPSPGNGGIQLDADGRVTHDAMAETYGQRQAPPPQTHPYAQAQPPIQNKGPQRRASYAPPPPAAPPAHHQLSYAPAHPAYNHAPPLNPQQPVYAPPPPVQQQPPPPPQVQQQPQYGVPPPPQQQPYAYPGPPVGYPVAPANNGQDLHRGQSFRYPTSNGPPPTQNGLMQNPGYSQPTSYRAPSPVMERAPSPLPPPVNMEPPTRQYIDNRPVLFYVKALYDYNATIDEEFDFQAGDVIAVTSTPEDGWWTGVLLDDTRRVPGRTVFPSNFVCLF